MSESLHELKANLKNSREIYVRQRREMAEFFGFETRNKYSIENDKGLQFAFAAEQQKGILGFLLRQFLGHWRRYEIHFFDPRQQFLFKAVHPFRWLFQRIELTLPDGSIAGSIQQRFSILTKSFDIEDAYGKVVLQVRSPFYRIWTFKFFRPGDSVREVARVEKWSGLLTEALFDKDNFKLSFLDSSLTEDEELVLLAAALFIDLQYFERKAGN